MIRLLLTLSLLVASATCFAQQMKLIDKEIAVGMTVKILPCKKTGTTLESMDMYRKTRIPEGKIEIDTASGEGVFENFFAPGDFDAKRLPCEYGDKKYKVAALRVFEDEKTKAEKRVMILYSSDPYTMIWVEFDKAIELKEIEF
jgi:hypothetical protein